MDCTAYRSTLAQLYHGGVPASAQRELADHESACEPCRSLRMLCEELSCREFVDFLDDYVECALPDARRETFERHLSICSDCRNYLEGYERTRALELSALRDDAPVPPSVPEDLLRAILAARRG